MVVPASPGCSRMVPNAGASRTDIVKRVLARAVLSRRGEGGLGQVLKLRRI